MVEVYFNKTFTLIINLILYKVIFATIITYNLELE